MPSMRLIGDFIEVTLNDDDEVKMTSSQTIKASNDDYAFRSTADGSATTANTGTDRQLVKFQIDFSFEFVQYS